jgi:hypothetical protein
MKHSEQDIIDVSHLDRELIRQLVFYGYTYGVLENPSVGHAQQNPDKESVTPWIPSHLSSVSLADAKSGSR